jgi:ParB family transcriptional regulator, chromosome partitioning protein
MTAKTGVLKSLLLSDINIKPNFNDRSKQHFQISKLKSLTSSIDQHGILQPVLVQKKGTMLIAGHRRIASATILAKKNGGIKNYKVPCKVLDITDREALELMMVENLQREDLTPLEEAKGFAKYLKKFPNSRDLAERCNKPSAYINKRVAILELPKEILKAWDKGELSFGHLMQFIRISPEDASKYFAQIDKDLKQWGRVTTVTSLSNAIERNMFYIKNALFNTKKAGCTKCHYNSNVQKTLFGQDSEKLRCLNPSCYVEKQTKHLEENWEETKKKKRLKTTCMVIRDSNQGYSDFNIFHKAGEASTMCETCDHFKTMFHLSGKIDYARTCWGEESCFKGAKVCAANGKSKTKKTQDVKSKAEAVQVERQAKRARTVEKIGVETRERHYESAIPEKIGHIVPQDDKALRLALIALIHSQADLHILFAKHFNINTGRYYYCMDPEKITHLVQHLDVATIKSILKDFSAEVIMAKDFTSEGRDKVAEFVGVDFKSDWKIDKQYLKRKQKPELIELIADKKHKLYDQPEVNDYIYAKLGKTLSTLETVKKSELIDVLVKSGADLSGIVPDEVRNPA